jgi:hypothetical protein
VRGDSVALVVSKVVAINPNSRTRQANPVRAFSKVDTAILELVWKGAHTGPLQTPAGIISASSKPVEFPACQITRVAGTKVKHASHYFDMLTMLTQIGATKG